MKAEEFIANLRTLSSPIEVEKFEDAEDYGDELVNLVMNYDISDVDFGDIGFAEEVLGDEETFEVGMFEEKFLVIDRLSKEVVVEEEDDDENSNVVFVCAADSEKFIDALWIATRYFDSRLTEKLNESHLEECEAVAKKCAQAAGNESYFPFYQDFLNCYER